MPIGHPLLSGARDFGNLKKKKKKKKFSSFGLSRPKSSIEALFFLSHCASFFDGGSTSQSNRIQSSLRDPAPTSTGSSASLFLSFQSINFFHLHWFLIAIEPNSYVARRSLCDTWQLKTHLVPAAANLRSRLLCFLYLISSPGANSGVNQLSVEVISKTGFRGEVFLFLIFIILAWPNCSIGYNAGLSLLILEYFLFIFQILMTWNGQYQRMLGKWLCITTLVPVFFYLISL